MDITRRTFLRYSAAATALSTSIGLPVSIVSREQFDSVPPGTSRTLCGIDIHNKSAHWAIIQYRKDGTAKLIGCGSTDLPENTIEQGSYIAAIRSPAL